jgi:hypothetical protein
MDIAFLVAGTPRSGTTLVQRVACELPGVAMSPETHFFASGYGARLARSGRLPLLGEQVRSELSTYQEAYRERVGRELVLDPERVEALVGPKCERTTDLFCAIVRTLADPGSVIGEKTPDHVRWWRPLAEAMPRLRFVLVVRDPRSVVESIMRMPWGNRSHLVLAERWCEDQRRVREAVASLGDRAVLVRYEDAVADPDGLRARLGASLGVAVGDRVVASPVPVIWPPAPWKERAFGPITTERVDTWKEALPPDQVLDIEAVCSAEMERFGYRSSLSRAQAFARRLGLEPMERRRRRRIRRARQGRIDATRL